MGPKREDQDRQGRMKIEYERVQTTSRAHDLSRKASAMSYVGTGAKRILALKEQADRMREASVAWRVAADKTDILVMMLQGATPEDIAIVQGEVPFG